MDFLKTMPQWAVAFIILVAGVIFFYVAMPPTTVCDAQLDVFKQTQIGFLYPNPKKDYIKTTGYERAVESCKLGAGAGGCRELFDKLRKMTLDLDLIPSECAEAVSQENSVKRAIFESADLFARLAWGPKVPASSFERAGWMDSFHLHVYCGLKRMGVLVYGKETWDEYANKTLTELPQVNQLERNEAWARTLMSVNCQQYR